MIPWNTDPSLSQECARGVWTTCNRTPKKGSSSPALTLLSCRSPRRRGELGALGGSPRQQRTPEGTPRSARSAAPEQVVEAETGKVDIDKLQQLSSATVSAWSMKRLINLVRYQVRWSCFCWVWFVNRVLIVRKPVVGDLRSEIA